MDEGALPAFAEEDRLAVLSSFEQGVAIIHAEVALWFFRSVAFEAMAIQDRFDVTLEVHGIGGCRGQFAFIYGGGSGDAEAEVK
jgi:hypothetical protein